MAEEPQGQDEQTGEESIDYGGKQKQIDAEKQKQADADRERLAEESQ
jgi:hypothetical protein